MKYKKIAGFIKKRKNVAKHTRKNEQWISDGNAAYPIIGMPVMNENEILRFLDFQDNDNISVTNWTSDSINLNDTAPNEAYIDKFGPSLIIGDKEYAVFYTDVGALLVNEAYIAPCFTHYGEGEINYWLRFNGNKPYIAVKKGLILLAAILPEKTWGIGDKILDDYKELCKMLELANNNFSGKEAEDEKNINGQTDCLGS